MGWNERALPRTAAMVAGNHLVKAGTRLFKTGRSQARTKKRLIIILHETLPNVLNTLYLRLLISVKKAKPLEDRCPVPFLLLRSQISAPHSHLLPYFAQQPKRSGDNMPDGKATKCLEGLRRHGDAHLLLYSFLGETSLLQPVPASHRQSHLLAIPPRQKPPLPGGSPRWAALLPGLDLGNALDSLYILSSGCREKKQIVLQWKHL